MVDNIKILVEDFDFTEDSELFIDYITVVKGFDGKDKTYLNKVLYSLLLSVSNESLNIANTGFKGVLFNSVPENSSYGFKVKYNNFINDWDEYNVSYKYLNKKVREFKKLLKRFNIKIDFSNIDQALSFYDEYKSYRLSVLNHLLEVEFRDEKNVNFDDYSVKVLIDDEYQLNLENNCKSSISYDLEELPGNIIYLSPNSIMDFQYDHDNIPYHYEELYYLLTKNQIKCKIDTDDIIDLITNTLGGEFDLCGDFNFYTDDLDEIDIRDLPNGFKQLGVLDLLLENYAIPEKSILIIDNIDYDMDEKLQNVTADILVKLASRLNLLLFINTQSDIFIKAINDYSDNIRNYEAIKSNDSKYKIK